MDTTGSPREGWMALIPLGVFVIFVSLIMGGPVNLINTLALWGEDLIAAVTSWLKNL